MFVVSAFVGLPLRSRVGTRAWTADIRRTRHIGDFSNWKDHDSFKQGFERLLRNLKSSDE